MTAPFELVLRYLSEIRSGPWSRFQFAIDQTAGKHVTDESEERTQAYRAAEDFAALGHIEVSSGEDRMWSIAPAALVQIPADADAAAVLAGARTWALERALAGFPCQRTSQAGGPDCILFTAPAAQDLRHIADHLGVAWSEDFSRSLAHLVPSTQDTWRAAEQKDPPLGWQAWRFSGRWWSPVSNDAHDGFYRYRHFTTEYRYRRNGRFCVLERSRGIYEFLREEGSTVTSYDPSTQELTVPAIAGLPPLAARAATLCSGFLPRVVELPDQKGKQLVYRNVPKTVADLILASLS